MSEVFRDAVAQIIHSAEMNEWPERSADPNGGCINYDRCKYVASRLLEPDVRSVMLRALGLREEIRVRDPWDMSKDIRRFMTDWEDVTYE